MTRLTLAALLLTGCTTTQVFIPVEDRPGLERQLIGEDRFLRVSCYSTPFFGDATKKLDVPDDDPNVTTELDEIADVQRATGAPPRFWSPT